MNARRRGKDGPEGRLLRGQTPRVTQGRRRATRQYHTAAMGKARRAIRRAYGLRSQGASSTHTQKSTLSSRMMQSVAQAMEWVRRRGGATSGDR
jgi:hypothetical protein